MSYQKQPKERKELIRRYNMICECGHKNGRHWYAVKNGTASHDCRDCDCLNFILQKLKKKGGGNNHVRAKER